MYKSFARFFAFFILLNVTIYSQSTGLIKGKIVDEDSGEELISATVKLIDNKDAIKGGAKTKYDGSYSIRKIAPGNYKLVISYVGYQKKTISDIVVKSGETKTFDVALSSDAVMTEEIVITAKAVKETGAALLKERQKAAAASDAIGAEEMSRKGASDAGDALKKVTGVTVQDGKSVVVRGLTNRYAKTQLNGANLPSADPDKRSVDLDMFGTNMIENIVTIKTATPDKPGDFTGGAVDIKTKSYPDKFFANISTSTNYNFQVTGEQFLIGERSDSDWFGRDDGKRGLQSGINDVINKYNGQLPDLNTIFTRDGQTRVDYYTDENGEIIEDYLVDNNEIIGDIENAAGSFANQQMSPVQYTAPVNRSMSVSIGDQYEIGNTPVGFIANFNYNRYFTSYQDGIFSLWELNDRGASELNNINYFSDSKGVDNVILGTMFSLSTTLFNYNEISFNVLYNQASENTGRLLSGRWPGSSGIPSRGFTSWSNRYVERDLLSFQLSGKHRLQFFENLGMDAWKIDWQVSTAENGRNEPNFSLFGYDWNVYDYSDEELAERGVDEDEYFNYRIQNSYPDPENPGYKITASAYDEPARIFRDMTETNQNVAANLEIPLEKTVGFPLSLKMGYLNEQINRNFEEYWFIYRWGNDDFPDQNVEGEDYQYNPDENPNGIFENYVGVTEDGNFIDPNLYLNYQSPDVNSYNADQDVNAYYGMIDFKIFNKLRIITGARVEESRLVGIPYNQSQTQLNTFKAEYFDATGFDTTGLGYEDFGIDKVDLLPSINIVYELFKNTNVRTAYYKTLARPNLREIAPYNSFDFIGGFVYIGNPFIQRTLIDNYDFRFEYFPNVGEIYAFSVYYKDFENPIEKAIVSTNSQIRFQNAPSGFVLGAEFEIRKNLFNIVSDVFGTKADFLKPFDFSFNLTLTESQVDIPLNSKDAAIIADAKYEDELDKLGRDTEEADELRNSFTELKDQYLDSQTGVKNQQLAETQALIDLVNPDLTRDFIGQSPYVLNFDVSYSNFENGWNVSTNFNVFGARLDFVQLGIDPNVYEQPRPDLNLIVSKKFVEVKGLENLQVKLSANNILNSWTQFSQNYNGQEFYNRRFRLGTSVSLGLKYTFN